MSFKDDIPPTSKEEAVARRVRPPPEKYDPDNLSHWSITMTLAWIIRRDIDAVRNESDIYRNECADWRFVRDPRARALADRIAIDKITGQIVPSDPDLQKKIQEKLQEHSWHFHQWKPSGWNTLPASEHIRPQVAIDELWQAAGEGRIKATAIEYKNAKAIVGDLVEIPAHYWPRLKRDPSGKPILSDDQGRIYREVKFPRLDGKKIWPKSPPLSGEPLEPGAVEVLPEPPEPERVEAPEPTRPAEPESLEPKASPTPTTASKIARRHHQVERAARHIPRVFSDGTDGISSEVIRKKLEKDPVLQAELAAQGGKPPSRGSIDRALGRRVPRK